MQKIEIQTRNQLNGPSIYDIRSLQEQNPHQFYESHSQVPSV